MRYLLLFLFAFFASCENQSFESDKRQLIAKNEVLRQLHKAHSVNVTGFKQDTLETYPDTTFKHLIRYGLDFVYVDSLGQTQKKKGVVLFTPDGKSVITSHIIDEQ